MHSINYYDEGDERDPGIQQFTSPIKLLRICSEVFEDFVLVQMMNVRWGWGNFSLIVCLGPEQNI